MVFATKRLVGQETVIVGSGNYESYASYDGADVTARTFSSFDVGAADNNKWVVVGAYWDGGGVSSNVSSITIDGETMTEAVSSGAAQTGCALYYHKFSGALPDIEITLASSAGTFGCAAWRILNNLSSGTLVLDSAHAEDAAEASLGTDENGNYVIACAMTQNGTTDPTLQGLSAGNKDFDVDISTNDYMIGYSATASTGTYSIKGVAEGNEYHTCIASFDLS